MSLRVKDTLRQAAKVVFALTQIFTGYFLTALGVGTSVGAGSAAARTPVTPAAYAFSIWGLIFLFCLLYAGYQAAPSRRDDTLLRRVGWFTAGTFFLNTVWILIAELMTIDWPTAVVITAILACSLGALFRLAGNDRRLTRKEQWLVRTPISLMAGWLSAAVFVNFAAVVRLHDPGYFGLPETFFSVMMIVLASAFALFVLIKAKGDALYGLAVVWALAAIIAANTLQITNIAVAATAGVMIAAVAAALVAVRIEN